jgi:hypothetical protein
MITRWAEVRFSGDALEGVLIVGAAMPLTVLRFALHPSAATSAAGVRHPCVFPEGTNHEL